MARIFVTGVSGFIGSHLAAALLERGDEVIGLVRTTSDTRALAPLFAQYGSRFRLVVGDLRQPESLSAGLVDVDRVFHLAAVLLGTSESEFMEANVQGTRNLLEAVLRHRTPRLKRVVVTSSLAAAGPSPDGKPLTEQDPARPVSWYGHSKLEAERVVREFAARGLPVTIARPVAVYGEREQDLARGTYPAVSLGLMPAIGFRRKHVSMIYVGDLVAGLIATESDGAVGKTYFFADPVPYRDRDVVRAVADAMGKRVRLPVVVPHFVLAIGAILAELAHRFARGRPAITRDKVREIRQRWWAASPAAAGADLGWRATVPIAEGMRRAVADWRTRRERDCLVHEALGDRALKTYLIAIGFGVVLEGVAWIGDWYRFHPPWLIVVIVIAVFGGVMGTVSLLAARRAPAVQFFLGAIVGIGAELLNHFWLHRWTFSPDFLAGLPTDPWLLALALGLPAGIMPVLVNGIVQALYERRLRLG